MAWRIWSRDTAIDLSPAPAFSLAPSLAPGCVAVRISLSLPITTWAYISEGDTASSLAHQAEEPDRIESNLTVFRHVPWVARLALMGNDSGFRIRLERL